MLREAGEQHRLGQALPIPDLILDGVAIPSVDRGAHGLPRVGPVGGAVESGVVFGVGAEASRGEQVNATLVRVFAASASRMPASRLTLAVIDKGVTTQRVTKAATRAFRSSRR
jgi:hypothetical protein